MKKPFAIAAILMMVFANSYAQSKPEFVKINWPKAEKWHIADQKKSDAQTMVELLKGNETFDNFTELGTTYSFRSTMYIPVKDKIEELYERVRKIAPTAKKTMIEQDEKAGCPWYLYKIESPTESQVWFAVQGKTELHVSFWAIRAAEVKSDLQDKWVKIFKSATINCK